MLISKIIIHRTSQKIYQIQSIKIYLDDIKIGSIKNGKIIEFPVEIGERKLHAKIGWYSTTPLILNINDNQRFNFSLGFNINPIKTWIPFYKLFFILFKPNQWIYLEPIKDLNLITKT